MRTGPFRAVSRSFALNLRLSSKFRSAAAVAVCALTLSGCIGESFASSGDRKHLRPVSAATLALIEQKGMSKESPILLRIYKEEAELEIWKQTTAGRYALLKKYPICRWSGELGPKIKQGDRQAPEGFYSIRPEQMNPNSSFHLAFNLGYPNEYDRAHGRTGAHLMVHGDCSSSGCYAMTDEQIQEIFALAREAFDGGQLAFQVQAFPFRMTNANMARHRNNPHLAFWRMLKEGSDHFEVTKLEPKIDVCNRRYIFNAIPNDPMKPFDPEATCPAYSLQPQIAALLQSRRNADNNDLTALVNRTLPAAPTRTGNDGYTNPNFNGRVPTPDANDASPDVPASAPATSGWPGFSLGGLFGFRNNEQPTAVAPPPERQPVKRTTRTKKKQDSKKADVQKKKQEQSANAQPRRDLPGATPIRRSNGFQ
jgi:murein L,D-transpeptidase YafK